MLCGFFLVLGSGTYFWVALSYYWSSDYHRAHCPTGWLWLDMFNFWWILSAAFIFGILLVAILLALILCGPCLYMAHRRQQNEEDDQI